MQILQKLKILGTRCSGITDAEYDTAPRVFEGQWHGRHLVRYYATFNRWNDERNVNVNRNDNDWNNNWWFAGVRNSLHFSPASAKKEIKNSPSRTPSRRCSLELVLE